MKNMKKWSIIILLLVLLFLLSISAFAAETGGSCGESVTWNLDSSTGLLSIIGTGAMLDYNNTNTETPWYEQRCLAV